MAELISCKTGWPTRLKYILSGSLQKCCQDLLYSPLMSFSIFTRVFPALFTLGTALSSEAASSILTSPCRGIFFLLLNWNMFHRFQFMGRDIDVEETEKLILHQPESLQKLFLPEKTGSVHSTTLLGLSFKFSQHHRYYSPQFHCFLFKM